MITIDRRRINMQINEPVRACRSAPANCRYPLDWHPCGGQQSSWGNQAFQRMLHTQVIQAKLDVNSPNGKYEREADRIAEQVVRMPEPCVQRQAIPEEEEEEELIQTKALDSTGELAIRRQPEEEEELLQTMPGSGSTLELTPSIAAKISAMQGGGQPLTVPERAFFEPRFRTDFSNVRFHADKPASEAAQALNGKAFTLGQDIFFGTGQFAPNSYKGKWLLAHELTHVVQQEPIIGKTKYPIPQNQTQDPPRPFGKVASEPATATEPVKLHTQPTDGIQRSTDDMFSSNGGEIPTEFRLQNDLEDVYFALAEIMTYYETKEAGWAEGVARMAGDALNSLGSLYTALGRKAIETERPELYDLQNRHDIDYFDLKNIFDSLHRAANPELPAEVIPTTVVGKAIELLDELRPWWEELGLDHSSPVIETIALTLPDPPDIEAQHDDYLSLFVQGLKQGLGKDIGEASVALVERHLRSSVALVVFQPIYLAGMVRGIYDKGAEIAAEIKKFFQDPQAFINEMIASIQAMLALPADQIAFAIGESTGQSIRETIDNLKKKDNAYAYIFELGKVMGPLVAGVIIEIIFSKGVGWLAGKALGVLRKSLERIPSIQDLRSRHALPAVVEAPDIDSPDVTPDPGTPVEVRNRSSPEITFEGEAHTVGMVKEDGRFVLWMCSDDCGPLSNKIRFAREAILDKDSDAYKNLSELEKDVDTLSRNWADPPTDAQRQALDDFRSRLKQIAEDDPDAMSAIVEGLGSQVREEIGGKPDLIQMEHPLDLKENLIILEQAKQNLIGEDILNIDTVLDLAPKVWKALQDPEAYVGVIKQLEGVRLKLSADSGSPAEGFVEAIRELAKQREIEVVELVWDSDSQTSKLIDRDGNPIVDRDGKPIDLSNVDPVSQGEVDPKSRGIADPEKFIEHVVASDRWVLDRSIMVAEGGSTHGVITHILQDMVVDAALRESGSTSAEFRKLLGKINKLPGNYDLGTAIWDSTYDIGAIKNLANPDTLWGDHLRDLLDIKAGEL